LHEEIFDMIKLIKKREVAEVIHLNTNALMLDREKSFLLIESSIDDITISIDAAREETYEKIKGASGLKELENNIECFFKLKNKEGFRLPYARVKIIEFKDTLGEVEEFIKKWEGIADEVQVTGVHNWCDGIEGLQVTDETKEKRYPCCLLWYELVVNSDGTVSPCQFDWKNEYLVGDIHKQTIAEIWNSDKMRLLRQAHIKGEFSKIKLCERCIAWAGGEDITDWYKSKEEFYLN